MRSTALWLLAALALASFTSPIDGAQMKVMIAPNLLRVGTPEKIFVECQDCSGSEIPVEIKVMNHPTKTETLTSTPARLLPGKSFQALAELTIPPGTFSRDPSAKQYVYLQAHFPDRVLEKVVMVSFQAGYIFIQTDKPLYTPGSDVFYRLFAVTPGMEPVERDTASKAGTSVAIEFVTPDNIVLAEVPVSMVGVHSGLFKLEDIFCVEELVGSSIFVTVSVLTETGGEMVEAEFRNIQIVESPYKINFQKTPTFFKPGMSFDVSVEVLNPDKTPASGVKVVVEPGNVVGFTAANGLARLTINTDAAATELAINARTDDSLLTRERQTSERMVAYPYKTRGNNYIHIGADTAELEKGDNFKINLNIQRETSGNMDIMYLIISRGQLVEARRHTLLNQVLVSLIVPITKEMIPSFRIVAYFHTNDNHVVSDSVWVDVKDSCMGTLRLESTRPAPSFEPRRMFGLRVTGDPGATVGLAAVDKGIFVLNKHRLTQKKIWDIVEKYDTGCTPGGGRDSMGVFYDAGLLFESDTAAGTPWY